MPIEPAAKRAVTFADGQNLYHAAKEAFGYTYPNYDILKLSDSLCSARGWQLSQNPILHGRPRWG